MFRNVLHHEPNPDDGVVRRMFYILNNYGTLSAGQISDLTTLWTNYYIDKTADAETTYYALLSIYNAVTGSSSVRFNKLMSHPIVIGAGRLNNVSTLSDYAQGGKTPTCVIDIKNEVYLGTVSAYSDLIETGSPTINTADIGEKRLKITPGTNYVSIPAALAPSGPAFAISIIGEETHADNGVGRSTSGGVGEIVFFLRKADGSNYYEIVMRTDADRTGMLYAQSEVGGTLDAAFSGSNELPPGSQKRFGMATETGTGSLRVASDGVLYDQNTTVPGIYDGSSDDIHIGIAGSAGNLIWIERIVIWDMLLGDDLKGASVEGPVDVIAVLGQSNSIGQDTYDGLGAHPARTREWTQAGAAVAADTHLDHVGAIGSDMGLDITLADDHPTRVLFVPCGLSTTSFSGNDWNPGDPSYNAAVSRVNAALAAVGGSSLRGIVFHMGETDSTAANSMTESEFAVALDAMIAGLRTDITGATDVAFVAGQISTGLDSFTYPTQPDVNAAIADLPNRVSNTAFTSSTGLTTFDALHFDDASTRVLGERMAAALATLN